MPDQVGVPDPHPKRKPTITAVPFKTSPPDLYLLDYPLPKHRAGLHYGYGRSPPEVRHQYTPTDLSGYNSAGFSDTSCGSSPSRSPGFIYKTGREEPLRATEDSNKPLSLVIRKNLLNFQDSNANVPKYIVHRKSQGSSSSSPFAPSPLENVSRENYTSIESGTEDLEPRPLVISEEEPPDSDEDVQEAPQDFSLKRDNTGLFSAEDEKTQSKLRIKDFAKFSSESSLPDAPLASATLFTGATSPPPREETSPKLEAEDLSDVGSECFSLSSADTWSHSLVEKKHLSLNSLAARRISRASNGETVYHCDFCEKMFSNKSHFNSHLVTHTGERAFTCKICQKTFGRKSTLRAHMTTHTKVSNFMCTVCDKACNDNNSLEEHMRMHTGEKPYICTICEKAYARKSHLNVHYRVHTGERPFICHHCDKDFTEKRFLNDHLQTAHNGVDGPLKCPNCSREFAYKTSLKQHLKKQMCERNINRSTSSSSSTPGSLVKQFQCPFCEKSYSWKQTLKQHVSMYHRNKVHTDEFWRYELTKNRRSVVDDKINEDLWKKQLGKHGSESDTGSIKNEPGLSLSQLKEEQIKWLEQINRSTSAEMSPEMKLFALQSLQKSLQYMSMAGNKLNPPSLENAGVSPEPEICQETISHASNDDTTKQTDNIKEEFESEQGESYLSLLARISQEKSPEMTAPLPPTSLESAETRTQIWLQQVATCTAVGQAEEPNNDQLWERQIARARINPVKSPLEPVEITLDDRNDGDEVVSVVDRIVTVQTGHIQQLCAGNNNNNSSINNNNSNNNNNNNNNFNNNNNNSNYNNNNKRLSFYENRSSAEDFDQMSLRGSMEQHLKPGSPLAQPQHGDEINSIKNRHEVVEDQSMLKSLLMDRVKRKRVSVEEKPAKKSHFTTVQAQDHQQSMDQTSGTGSDSQTNFLEPQEILRKRLLGWVDAPNKNPSASNVNSAVTFASTSPLQAATAIVPHVITVAPMVNDASVRSAAGVNLAVLSNIPAVISSAPAAAMPPAQPGTFHAGSSRTVPTGSQNTVLDSKVEMFKPQDKVNSVDLNCPSEEGKVSYTQTSVLKHLLYRYTQTTSKFGKCTE